MCFWYFTNTLQIHLPIYIHICHLHQQMLSDNMEKHKKETNHMVLAFLNVENDVFFGILQILCKYTYKYTYTYAIYTGKCFQITWKSTKRKKITWYWLFKT